MKILSLMAFVIVMSISSAFADVHCDADYGTELHSSEELKIGTKRFTNSSDCSFAAAAANERGSKIVCAPYEDARTKGYSVYRLEDGKDLGEAVFSTLNDCQFTVLFSFADAFCAPFNGKYAFWLIEENEQFQTAEFTTLQACIVASKEAK